VVEGGLDRRRSHLAGAIPAAKPVADVQILPLSGLPSCSSPLEFLPARLRWKSRVLVGNRDVGQIGLVFLLFSVGNRGVG
jgi:hypothetical protein